MVGRFAFLTVEYLSAPKTATYCFVEPFSLRFIVAIFAKQAFLSTQKAKSAEKKKAQERRDEEYEPEGEESDIGTPKKGGKKKQEPDPGLTMGTDIEYYLKPDGKQVNVNLEDI